MSVATPQSGTKQRSNLDVVWWHRVAGNFDMVGAT